MSDESDFQRARSPEQKGERRSLILETARALLIENPSEKELSLNDLARRVGMAKSNLYRYFESREAIFLELLRLEWAAWVPEFQQALVRGSLPCADVATPAGRRAALDAIAVALAATLAARPFLGRLSAILPTVLEYNVEAETIRSFKLESIHFLAGMGELLHQVAPALSARKFEELLHLGITVLVGAWSFGHPSDTVRAVLAQPELACMRADFERDFARHLSLLGRALLEEELCASHPIGP